MPAKMIDDIAIFHSRLQRKLELEIRFFIFLHSILADKAMHTAEKATRSEVWRLIVQRQAALEDKVCLLITLYIYIYVQLYISFHLK